LFAFFTATFALGMDKEKAYQTSLLCCSTIHNVLWEHGIDYTVF